MAAPENVELSAMRRSDPARFYNRCADALRKAEGHRGKAASSLGISLRTLHRYLVEHPEIGKRAGKHGEAKHGANHGDGEKAAFIRKQPSSLSAKEVVAKAKQKGLEMTPSYVSIVRWRGEHASKAIARRRK